MANDVAKALGAMRTAVGASTWLTPRVSGRIFGLGSSMDDGRAAFVGRLFGSRDVVLGLGVLGPSALGVGGDETLRRALEAGIVVDSIDFVAGLLARRRGVSWYGVVVGAGGAAMLATMGVIARLQLEPTSASSA